MFSNALYCSKISKATGQHSHYFTPYLSTDGSFRHQVGRKLIFQVFDLVISSFIHQQPYRLHLSFMIFRRTDYVQGSVSTEHLEHADTEVHVTCTFDVLQILVQTKSILDVDCGEFRILLASREMLFWYEKKNNNCKGTPALGRLKLKHNVRIL